MAGTPWACSVDSADSFGRVAAHAATRSLISAAPSMRDSTVANRSAQSGLPIAATTPRHWWFSIAEMRTSPSVHA